MSPAQPVDYRVMECNVCGAKFRFPRVRITHPREHWPPVTYGVEVDLETDTAMREHATTHGGFLDKDLAYTGPTTFTAYNEPWGEP